MDHTASFGEKGGGGESKKTGHNLKFTLDFMELMMKKQKMSLMYLKVVSKLLLDIMEKYKRFREP